jgi:RNA recognition motif-containing protein
MTFAMRPQIMECTSEARDFYALTKDILALCEPFGPVHSFKLVHNRGAARVACLVELESSKEQPALARALGGRAINGSVCLEIAVRRDFEARGNVVAIAPQPDFEARVAAS